MYQMNIWAGWNHKLWPIWDNPDIIETDLISLIPRKAKTRKNWWIFCGSLKKRNNIKFQKLQHLKDTVRIDEQRSSCEKQNNITRSNVTCVNKEPLAVKGMINMSAVNYPNMMLITRGVILTSKISQLFYPISWWLFRSNHLLLSNVFILRISHEVGVKSSFVNIGLK